MNRITNIPKKIHYCWFGGGDKPDIVKRCLDSWHKHLTDYEIIEWNEENIDLTLNNYMKEAYKAKKYAFVSDYVRIHALYQYGGIYLDTDVEVFRSFDNLLYHHSFWGFEQENFIATSTIGASKGNKLIKEFLDLYLNKPFIKNDGSIDEETNVAMVTNMLQKHGLERSGKCQLLGDGNIVYPQLYFSPYDYINCRNFKTSETYTMHHFYKSWLPKRARVKSGFKSIAAKVIGGDNIARLRKIVSNS